MSTQLLVSVNGVFRAQQSHDCFRLADHPKVKLQEARLAVIIWRTASREHNSNSWTVECLLRRSALELLTSS